MSSFDYENPKRDIYPEGGMGPRVDPDDPTANALAFKQAQVDLSQQLSSHFSTLSSLTSQMKDNLEGIGTLIQQNAGHLNEYVGSQTKINNLERDSVRHQTQLTASTKERARAAREIQEAEAKGTDAVLAKMRGTGMIGRGGIRYGEGQVMPTGQFRNLDPNSPEYNQIRQSLQTNLARGPNRTFRFGDVFQQLSQGNIGGAIGELTQSLPMFQRAAARSTTIGENLSISGLERGGIAGLGQRFGGAFMSTAVPFALSPAAAYLAQRYVRQGIRTYQSDLRQGMQTGLEGRAAAGEAARANLQARIQGLNPFDALTMQMAQEVAKGIQSQGFSGQIRAAWQDTVTDVIKSTGMDASTALGLMNTATDQLGESAEQFRNDIEGVQTVAKETSLSIRTLAEDLQRAQTSFASRGGMAAGQAITQTVQALQTTLPRSITMRGALTQGIAQNWQAIALRFGGISPTQAFTAQAISQAPRIIDNLVNQLFQIKNSTTLWRNMSVENWIAMMEGTAPAVLQALIPGADARDFIALMQSKAQGKSVQSAANRRRVQAAQEATQPKHSGFLGGLAHHLSGIESAIGEMIGRGGLVSGEGLPNPLEGEARKINKTFVDVNKMRQEQINYWLNQIHLAGLSPEEQRRILAPVRAAGSSEALDRAAQEAANTFKVEVGIHPSAAQILTAEPAHRQTYWDHMNGDSGSYGMQRPVIPGRTHRDFRGQ